MIFNTMELKEFIKETLISIIEGVDQSKVYLKEVKSTAVINATLSNAMGSKTQSKTVSSQRKIFNVDMDIAVSVETTKETKGKAGVKIKVFDLGIGGSKEVLNSTISRVKFSVPILYPV